MFYFSVEILSIIIEYYLSWQLALALASTYIESKTKMYQADHNDGSERERERERELLSTLTFIGTLLNKKRSTTKSTKYIGLR